MQVLTTNCIEEVDQKNGASERNTELDFWSAFQLKFLGNKKSCEFDFCQDVFL